LHIFCNNSEKLKIFRTWIFYPLYNIHSIKIVYGMNFQSDENLGSEKSSTIELWCDKIFFEILNFKEKDNLNWIKTIQK
jgi:hypothetical protein